jgi:PglZ domain
LNGVVISNAKVVARVASILPKNRERKPIGIRVTGPYRGDSSIVIDGHTLQVLQCDTVLSVREALLEHPNDSVILTPVEDRDLGWDVLARLARTKLHTLQPWPILLEDFKANDVSPKLLESRGVAEYLLEHRPAGGFAPATSGKIDEETAWKIILGDLSFSTARPDVRAILEWASSPAGVARYRAFPDELRESLHSWIAVTAGAEGRMLFDAIDAGFAADLIPLGLVLQVAFETNDAATSALRIRLENFTRGRGLSETGANVWAAGATASVIARLHAAEWKTARTKIERADAFLAQMFASELAVRSPISLAGLEQHFDRFAVVLQQALDGSPASFANELANLEDHSLTQAFDNDWNELYRHRVRRARMATRLARWLQTPAVEPAAVDRAAASYARDSAYADWARHIVADGDNLPTLAAAYRRLATLTMERREQENLRFAEHLASASKSNALGQAIGIESVLAEVVAPVVREGQRVLLLVMDGMSTAVFHQLLQDIQRLGWSDLHSEAARWPRPVIAALPSVTEVSRASLFAGRLAQGKSDFEKDAFATQPALLEVCGAGAPPVLFHKATLSEAGGAELSKETRDAISSDKRRIVGAVVNAVDDFLLKGGQTVLPTTLDSMPVVRNLLYEAEQSRRVVVLTSDHGHVIDRGTTFRAADGAGERYRPAGETSSGEVLLTGKRVVVQGNAIVAAATEGIRYSSSKRFGYHGGATPQECVVPLAVLGREPFGTWLEVAPQLPAWWEPGATTTAPVFEIVPATIESPATSAPATSSTPHWLDQLFASDVFAAQMKLAARMAPSEDQLRRLLLLLDERKGTAIFETVAQRLNVPEFRVSSIVTAVRKVLNVEGYAVITLEDGSKTVTLHYDLLRVQFDLDE